MRKAICILCISTLFACKSKTSTIAIDSKKNSIVVDTVIKKFQTVTITPYSLNDDYTVIDTGFFDAVVSEGTYAVVQRNGKLADTIDKYYGIKKIANDHYLYLTITGTGPLYKDMSPKAGYKNSLTGSLGDYILITGGKKEYLHNLIKNFDDHFSSPWVINNKIYFWQLKNLNKDGETSVSAAEYDPLTRYIKTYYIKNDYIETDDNGYFPYPYVQKDTIFFDAGSDKLTKFSKDFKTYN